MFLLAPQLVHEPLEPFVPLLLVPEVGRLLIDTQLLGGSYHVVGRIGGRGRHHVVVVAKREPTRAGDAAGEVHAIVIARGLNLVLTGFALLG